MTWDDLPRDVQKLIMDMRFELMREEKERRFWAAVWENMCSFCNGIVGDCYCGRG